MIYNCHGDLNIGMMIRTAACLGARKVYLIGRRKYDARSVVGSDKYIEVIKHNEIKDLKKFFFEEDMEPIFVEQGGIDINCFNFKSVYNFNRKPCLVLGSECDGIPEDFMKLFPDSVRLSIGQIGVIRSMNVATVCSIILEKFSAVNRKSVVDKYGLI